jgi:hypothetical protein
MGTGYFKGVKRSGRGVDHPPPSSAEVKERVELYLHPPLRAFVACSRVNFTPRLSLTVFNSTQLPANAVNQTINKCQIRNILSTSVIEKYSSPLPYTSAHATYQQYMIYMIRYIYDIHIYDMIYDT